MKPNGQYIPLHAGDRGMSDMMVCLPDGRFAAIEVKKKGNKPTPEQLVFRASPAQWRDRHRGLQHRRCDEAVVSATGSSHFARSASGKRTKRTTPRRPKPTTTMSAAETHRNTFNTAYSGRSPTLRHPVVRDPASQSRVCRQLATSNEPFKCYCEA